MIDNKCFTTEWIQTKAKELNYSDTNLIEKVIRALSLLLPFILTPDKHLDWSTAIVMLSFFAVIFLLPYMVCMVYGKQISSFLLKLWNDKLKKKDRENAIKLTYWCRHLPDDVCE